MNSSNRRQNGIKSELEINAECCENIEENAMDPAQEALGKAS